MINTSNRYYLMQSPMCYITLFLLLNELKMSSSGTNANSGRWRHSPTVNFITSDTVRLTHCWCIISVRRCTTLK